MPSVADMTIPYCGRPRRLNIAGNSAVLPMGSCGNPTLWEQCGAKREKAVSAARASLPALELAADVVLLDGLTLVIDFLAPREGDVHLREAVVGDEEPRRHYREPLFLVLG